MNLSAYDKVSTYYTFLKKYDSDIGETYYIAVLDTVASDRQVMKTKKDDYGRLKFNISSIAGATGLNKYKNNTNVPISLVDHQEDCDIYLLDI